MNNKWRYAVVEKPRDACIEEVSLLVLYSTE